MKHNFRPSQAPPKFDPNSEEDMLTAEVGGAIVAAKGKPRSEVFSTFLQSLPDTTLLRLLDGMNIRNAPDADHPSHSAFILGVIFLRSHLHGDKRNGFAASDSELLDITNTVQPYLSLEFIRRRNCFESFDLPESPWAFNASLRVREPNLENITKTVAEMNELGVPFPPLLTDSETLKQMREDDIGVEMPMPVLGRGVADERLLNVQYQKLPSVDPVKFAKALREVNDVAFSSASLPGMDFPDIDRVSKKGVVSRLDTQDNPALRATRVITNHFLDNQDEAQSALIRFFALTKLMRDDAFPEWIQHRPNGIEIHPAVLVAAATVKLTKGGQFAPNQFRQEVKHLAAESQVESNN